MDGSQIGAGTLRNFFALHTAVFPAAIVCLMAYHFWRVRKAGGLVVPRSPGEMAKDQEKPLLVPSNPDLLWREAAVGLSAAAFILTLALLFDAPLGPPANPGLSPNPTKAPWYFAGVQEMLMHFHPTFALVIVLILALGGFLLLPYLGGGVESAGVWFVSAVGRRTAVASAVASVLITPLAVMFDEHVTDGIGWPLLISKGLIPTVLLLLAIVGVSVAAKKAFRASRPEIVQAAFIFLVVGFAQLTVICLLFRIKGMKLGWVWG
jgi:hypothetical protein